MEFTGKDKASYVRETFNSIADRYDFINILMSLGQDHHWRSLAVQRLKLQPGANVLDACCGTGKLSLELSKAVGSQGTVTGVDFSENMLKIARQNVAESGRGSNIHFQQGDAMALAFADNTFDGVSVGWGLRNLPDLEKGIRELFRVAKPGAKMVSLDMGKPALPVFKQGYWLYFEKMVPLMGKIWSHKKDAYEYLYQSAREFPSQQRLSVIFRKCGFTEVRYHNLMGGVVAIVEGRKPADGRQ